MSMTDEERDAAFQAAMEKISEGTLEAARLRVDDGDMVSLESAFVLFEVRGLEPSGASFSLPGSFIATINQLTSSIGLVTLQAPVLAQKIQQMASSCDHDHDA